MKSGKVTDKEPSNHTELGAFRVLKHGDERVVDVFLYPLVGGAFFDQLANLVFSLVNKPFVSL